MSPDDWNGDLEDYVETVLDRFAATLGMDAEDARREALSERLLLALERRRFHQKLASLNFSRSETEKFFSDARRAQALIVTLRQSPVWSWLHSKYGVIPVQNDYLERMLQHIANYDQEIRRFEANHPHAFHARNLMKGIDASGNNLLILDDLPRIYAVFGGEVKLKSELNDYTLPDIAGRFNDTSSFITFLIKALEVLCISNNGVEWTTESLVQRMKRARDDRPKKS